MENETVNQFVVEDCPVTYLPDERAGNRDMDGFHNQDVPAYMMSMQAQAILHFPFMRHIHKHSKCLTGYQIQREIFETIIKNLNIRFCPENIVLSHGSLPEIELSKATFASDIGCFDLYKVLGQGYPVYHAEMTRRIPAYVAANMDELIHAGASKIKTLVELLVWGEKRRFMGAGSNKTI